MIIKRTGKLCVVVGRDRAVVGQTAVWPWQRKAWVVVDRDGNPEVCSTPAYHSVPLATAYYIPKQQAIDLLLYSR